MNNQIKIGNYTILNSIGAGTFGKVKMAVHNYTGQKVALKILNRRRIVNLHMVPRLKREVQYLKLLKHTHIIKLYEVITTPTDIILVLEYAGGELFNYIVEKGRMSEGEARKLFQQIIGAVEHCHIHKIVHRDLKPENILMDNYKNIKIADFGLSNYLDDGEFLKTSCGSPNYAAPEVISGKLYGGPEIDIWSCGVILYVMLCGQLPFDDEHIPTLFKKINSGIFRLPSFLSNSAKELLTSMIVVDPLKRITIPEIRKTAWFSKDLPSYLTLDENKGQRESEYINDEIVQEIAKKMKFSLQTIFHALEESENNQIKVAYQLIVDSKRDDDQSIRDQVKQLLPVEALIEEIDGLKIMKGDNKPTLESSSIQLLSSSVPTTPLNPEPLDPRKTRTTRSRWHYGIRSRSDPLEIMHEIYQALSKTDILWKSITPYLTRCLHVNSRDDVVRFEIQLYKIESGNYLVDFKRLNANHHDLPCSIFTFFDACTKLITELAVAG